MFSVDATGIATALLGDSIAANLFTLGFAWQRGLIPIGSAAIEEAVKLNGVAVKMNLAAFLWGRRAAVDEAAVRAILGSGQKPKAQSLDELIARREAFLTGYQNAAYAKSYRAVIDRVRSDGGDRLTETVARNLFKLMAYKDEYEVARLYSDGAFAKTLAQKFKGDYRLKFHLAPPIMGRRDGFTGRPVKSEFGPWMMQAFKILARLKGLRGTVFDVFGYTAERKRERKLIVEYLTEIAELLESDSHRALDVAAWPEMIRGFGHVKEESIARARALPEAARIAALAAE